MSSINITNTSVLSTWGTGYTYHAPTTGGVWNQAEPANLTCGDIIVGDQRLSDLLKNMPFVALPVGLDLTNPTVMSMVTEWYRALEQLRLAHEKLLTVVELTKNPNE